MCARKQTNDDRSVVPHYRMPCLQCDSYWMRYTSCRSSRRGYRTKRPEIVAQLKKAIQDWEATVSNPKQYGLSSR